MSTVAPYTEGSPEFNEMLAQAEANQDGGRAAHAAGNCYMYGSSRFCEDWYECIVLKNKTVDEYDKHVTLVEKCLSLVR